MAARKAKRANHLPAKIASKPLKNSSIKKTTSVPLSSLRSLQKCLRNEANPEVGRKWREFLIPVTDKNKKALSKMLGKTYPKKKLYHIGDDVRGIIPYDVLLALYGVEEGEK